VTTASEAFGVFANQVDEFNSVDAFNYGSTFGAINTLYSYIYIKSDTWGTLNWGHLSPASDNPAVLADISGTVIESNFVGFEGAGFFLSPAKGSGNVISGARWIDFWGTNTLIAPGADAFGAAQPAVRYDSPTWGGFRFETSYGTASLVPQLLDQLVGDYPCTTGVINCSGDGTVLGDFIPGTDDSHFWDVALFYTADWNSIKLSLAAAYTWLEALPISGSQEDIWQVGGSIMHKPSGLGIYAMGQWENPDSTNLNDKVCAVPGCLMPILPTGFVANAPDTSMWGVKPFWRKAWSPIGATVLYGEFAQYDDFFGATFANGVNPNLLNINCTGLSVSSGCFITGSEMERWGLGVVQEIDSAAMHVWARWQHQELEVNLRDFNTDDRLNYSSDDFNLYQVGGIIFF
jgi:hypothetical protein